MPNRTILKRETIRLVAFCAIALAGSAIATLPFVAKKARFDNARFNHIRARQPEFVLIGDSLLGYSIDQNVLEQEIGGRKTEILWHGGAASAAWYLYLKNFVAGAGVHPRRVFLFIHDDVLTDPEFRTTGKHAVLLQALRREREPLVDRLTDDPSRKWWLRRLVSKLYPADANRLHYQQKIDAWMRRLVTLNRKRARALEANANAVFDVPKLRTDQPIVAPETRRSFDEALASSFLPHIIEIARAGGYAITFVRPKKREGPYADFDDTPAMKQYYGALKAYLQKNGCELFDMTHDPAITSDMFSDNSHIGPWATTAFTKHFAAELADRFR